LLRISVMVAVLSLLGACTTVAPYRRSHLADPMMSLTDGPLETYRKQKLYNTREGAAGGDGAAAGGGCGCN
jgi:hypothetical protein